MHPRQASDHKQMCAQKRIYLEVDWTSEVLGYQAVPLLTGLSILNRRDENLLYTFRTPDPLTYLPGLLSAREA